MNDLPKTFDVQEVAAVLGTSPQWVAAQARCGLIPGRKIARRWRFTAADIAEALEMFRPTNPYGITPTTSSARRLRM